MKHVIKLRLLKEKRGGRKNFDADYISKMMLDMKIRLLAKTKLKRNKNSLTKYYGFSRIYRMNICGKGLQNSRKKCHLKIHI